MCLKPGGLTIPEKSWHIQLQNMQHTLFQSNKSRFLVCLPFLPVLSHHPNNRIRSRTVWMPRGPSHGAAPATCMAVSVGPLRPRLGRPRARPSVDPALLCLRSAVSLLPFEQISLLHCTGLLYF